MGTATLKEAEEITNELENRTAELNMSDREKRDRKNK